MPDPPKSVPSKASKVYRKPEGEDNMDEEKSPVSSADATNRLPNGQSDQNVSLSSSVQPIHMPEPSTDRVITPNLVVAHVEHVEMSQFSRNEPNFQCGPNQTDEPGRIWTFQPIAKSKSHDDDDAPPPYSAKELREIARIEQLVEEQEQETKDKLADQVKSGLSGTRLEPPSDFVIEYDEYKEQLLSHPWLAERMSNGSSSHGGTSSAHDGSAKSTSAVPASKTASAASRSKSATAISNSQSSPVSGSNKGSSSVAVGASSHKSASNSKSTSRASQSKTSSAPSGSNNSGSRPSSSGTSGSRPSGSSSSGSRPSGSGSSGSRPSGSGSSGSSSSGLNPSGSNPSGSNTSGSKSSH